MEESVPHSPKEGRESDDSKHPDYHRDGCQGMQSRDRGCTRISSLNGDPGSRSVRPRMYIHTGRYTRMCHHLKALQQT